MGTGDYRHGHAHGHDHDHDHTGGLGHSLRSFIRPHSHDPVDSIDQEMESSHSGVRAVAVSLLILLVTAAIQATIVALSGSVALLSDTLHNAADALTAVPLWLAFRLGRRPPTPRFTYGLGKAEDLAGLAVVALVAFSAAIAAYVAVQRLIHPEKVTHLPVVVVAGLIGALGNEVVARYRVRVGRRIGSAALEADGQHARADGFTSLLVVFGALGVAVGLDWADAVVGLVIAAVILVVLVRTAGSIGQRVLDAVDPQIVDQVRKSVSFVDWVEDVSEVRARWIGHRLFAQVRLSVGGSLTVSQGHGIAEASLHRLLHDVPNLADAIVHVDPTGIAPDPHATTAHHRTRGG
jgi:cation diffusion facilitator family transporter